MDLQIPEFLDRDVNAITSDMISFYETATGKTLQPAQPERLLINAFAYREALLRNAINDACLQNLVNFSRFPILDYLGQLVGVTRLVPQKAVTTIEFTFNTGHGSITIPQGTRVTNGAGSIIFEVETTTILSVGIDIIEIKCISQNTGKVNNGYLAGSLNILLDSLTAFASCSNLDDTSGGSDEETDEQLRERIKLSPSRYSVAGPIEAYKYFAFSANPEIIDVAVISPVAGQVNIYPLTNTVPTPQSILNEVYATCNAEKVRPDTDLVIVLAPTALNYSININLTLYNNSDDVSIVQQITELLNSYTSNVAGKLGIDVVKNQIISLCMVEGVYNANLTSIASDLVVSGSEFGNCTGISVNIIGYTNG